MECPNCGATISDSSDRCRFCNSAVSAVTAPPRVATLAETFERIRGSEIFAQASGAQRQAALPTFSGVQKALPIAFGAIFMLASLAILGGFCTVGGLIGNEVGGLFGLLPLLIAIVPLGFVVVGALMIVHFVRKFREFDQAQVLVRPAVVTGKRTEVSGGGENSRARTAYHITWEFEDGTRQEFQAMQADLYSRVSERDAGVLFTRAGLALDFDRVVAET